MAKTTVYEYMLYRDKIIKVPHVAEVSVLNNQQTYKFKAGKSEKHTKFLMKKDFGVVVNNHVFSQQDDFGKYEEMIIQSIKSRIVSAEEKLARDRKLLATLMENADGGNT